MKKMKRYLALSIALLLLVSAMSATAFAAGVKGHTYDVYQIFKGTLDDTNDHRLTNLEWGNGVNPTTFLSKVSSELGLSGITNPTVNDVAKAMDKVLSGVADDSAKARWFALAAYECKATKFGTVTDGNPITNAPAGYYLLVDASDADPVKNMVLLRVYKGGVISITEKVSAPEMIKKVKDADDSSGSVTDWQDSADYDIGDMVPFQLKATLGKIDGFERYQVLFEDTLSNGLTFVNTGAYQYSIKIDDVDKTSSFGFAQNGQNLKFWSYDVKALGAKNGSVITVDFYAQLNENAKLGEEGNPNVARMYFSNNPLLNEAPSSTNDAPNPNNPDHPMSPTPDDKVIVFTYQLQVNKVDQDGRALSGAAFTLYKLLPGTDSNGERNKKVVGEDFGIASDNRTDPNKPETATQFTWTGLDDGDYLLTETVVPTGYNKMEDQTFKIEAGHVVYSDNPTLDSLTCNGNSVDVQFGVVKATGVISTSAVNKYGAVLPETGGDGMNQVLYTVGGILLLGAGVAFVVKRKVGSK